MARTHAASPRLQRLGAFAATALLAATTAVAFGRVFTTGSTTVKLLAAGLASAGVACLFERRNLLLATAVSGALMVVAVGALVLPWTTWHGLPTVETLRVMGDSATLVGQQARIQVAPTPPLPPLLLAAVTAIWAAIFSAHALAFRASSPLLALLPPVALLAFADTVLEETFRPGFGLLFLGAGLAVVFVDGLRRVQRWGPMWSWPGSHRRLAPATTRGAGRVAAGALAIATIAPLVLPGIGSKAVIDLSSTPGSDVLRIDPQVAIASALRSSKATPIFTVETDHASYYRMLALDHFDGNAWSAPDPSGAGAVTGGALRSEPPGAQVIRQTFHVDAAQPLSLPGVPVAFPPLSVTMPDDRDISYDDALQAVYVDGDLGDHTTYEATSLLEQPDPRALESYRLPAAGVDPRWVALPDDAQTSQIHRLALQWTQGATTPYDQVRAILAHLAPDHGFRYDTRINQGDDTLTLLRFLTDTKAGFCQQFASAMAVLLRSIGIPARVAMGFTDGRYDSATGRWIVTTKDAHSWVEVNFGSFGWLSFEPTPGRANPVAFEYADLKASSCQLTGGTAADCGTDGTGGVTPGQNRTDTTGSRGLVQARILGNKEGVYGPPSNSRGHPRGTGVGGPSAGRDEGPTRAVLAALVVLGLLLIALIPPARALRRRARLRRAAAQPRRSILVAYDVFTERAAGLGLARHAGETPQEYRRRLAASGRTDGDLDALTRLTVRAAYAAPEPGAPDADEARRAAVRAIRDLRRGTPLARRVVGAWFPER
jgi:transglutaminase-like putative cysteine protease